MVPASTLDPPHRHRSMNMADHVLHSKPHRHCADCGLHLEGATCE